MYPERASVLLLFSLNVFPKIERRTIYSTLARTRTPLSIFYSEASSINSDSCPNAFSNIILCSVIIEPCITLLCVRTS